MTSDNRNSPLKREPLWYVHDFSDGFQYFKTEKEAHDCFLKGIQAYKDEAAGDEWPDETEHLSWGMIFQTVVLARVKDTENDEYELKIQERRP